MTTRRAILLALPLGLAATRLHAQTAQLTVSAAASLTDVMRDLGSLFESANPSLRVRFNFGASGALLQQIAQGAPVDVFISADEETIERGLAQKLLLAGSRRNVAGNSVVLITPKGESAITALRDLAVPALRRIAIGKPLTVPAGRYTQQALEAAGMWSKLEPRFVFADSVRQVLDYVARGEVEAGFVYATDAQLMADRVRVVLVVSGHGPVRYPAAVVAESRHADRARAFVDFLISSPAQQRFVAAGFLPAAQ